MTDPIVSREACGRAPREAWHWEDVRRLKRLVELQIPRDDIADILDRSVLAVRSKISRLGWGRKYHKPAKWR